MTRPRLLRIYGVLKIYKKDTPPRPNVCAINSLTYSLEGQLAGVLKTKIEKTLSYMKNSTHFVQKMKLT